MRFWLTCAHGEEDAVLAAQEADTVLAEAQDAVLAAHDVPAIALALQDTDDVVMAVHDAGFQ